MSDALETAHNNSFNRSASNVAFIENLNLLAASARPVNSSVRHASLKQGSSGLNDAA